MSRGYFISFEGPDGCGKTTQINMFKAYLEAQGFEVVLTREPGGTPISEKIREIILSPEFKEESPVTETLLFAASRAQHVAEKIKPALGEGKVVICDRFVDSSLAYQAYARGLGEDVVMINQFAVQGCMPDLTFFLDLDPVIGQQRQIARGKLDRLEQDGLNLQKKVYDAYLKLMLKYPDRYRRVDAGRDPKLVADDIKNLFEEFRK